MTRGFELVMWFMSLEKGFGVVWLVYEFGNEVWSYGVEGGFVLNLQGSGCVKVYTSLLEPVLSWQNNPKSMQSL